MNRAFKAFNRAVTTAELFGSRYVLRRMSRAPGQAALADLAGVGPIWLRKGSTDSEVFRQVFLSREYELRSLRRAGDIEARYEAILAAGRVPVIVDAGANIGAASLWFANAFPRAHIVAVEPEPANVAMCRKNIASRPSISVLEAAIGSSSGRVTLNNPAGKAWSPRSERSDEGNIEVVTIQDAVDSVPDGQLFIVKMDIEGFESDVFASGTEWIDDTSVLIIEIHDWMRPGGETSFTLQRAMSDRRFEIVISGENLIYINTNLLGVAAKT